MIIYYPVFYRHFTCVFIDFNEFSAMMDKKIQSVFAKIDKDGSGDISPDEMKAALPASINISDFLKIADKDGDGEISNDEFAIAIAENGKKFVPILFAFP